MKTVKELQLFEAKTIDFNRIQPRSNRIAKFSLGGELGFRLNRAAHRIESELPYSKEYLLSQITGTKDQWSNFPRFHADIAGRWVLAETYFYAGETKPPKHLAEIIEELLIIQNSDGSFGIVSFEEEPLNMHKAYGNGWMIKALAQYAITFGDERVCQAAIKMGAFYERTFPLWADSSKSERDTKYYATSISCYYHAFDGIFTLYQLTNEKRWLKLLEKFIPNLTPLDHADHSHMYLTIRRGLLKYYLLLGMDDAIASLSAELHRCYDACILETGGVPERFWLPEGEQTHDEACSLFDWELLTTQMFEATGETEWLDYAILNLENQIFYNQTYNGGFGSCELGGAYKQQGKEAPWCCSVFGPYGLIEAGASFVHFSDDSMVINHLISGEFMKNENNAVLLNRDDKHGRYVIDTSSALEIRKIKIYVPHWLELSTSTGKLIGRWFMIDVEKTMETVVDFEYKVWLSNKGKAPKQIAHIPNGKPFILFYGPWMLTHRFHLEPCSLNLELDEKGYVTNSQHHFMRGMNFYGETTRIIIPANRVVEPMDTFRGVYEGDGEIYMYPLKDKESPNRGNPVVYG